MASATKDRKRGTSATGITFNRETLLAAVKGVAAAVPSRSPKPIIQNVLLHKGHLRGTDLELSISYGMPWTDDPMLLPHARLRSILENSTGEEVTLTPDGSACVVRSGRGEWRLPVEDPLEFPAWEPDGMRLIARVPADQFCRAVRSVVYATDNESSRYALGAVCIEYERQKGKLSFVATDGRRLSACHMVLGDNQDPDDSQTLVPERAIRAIASLASHTDGFVQLESNGKEVVASCDDASVTARLVDGRFPRWRDVFPDRPDAKLHTVNIDALWHATRAAAIVTTEQSKGVDYAFTESGLTLSGRSAESGESTVACDVVESGSACTVKLDPVFVDQACRALLSLEGEPSVRISVAGKGDAVVFTYGEDDEYRSVIMPLAHD